jgi:hypothetical protein
VIPSELSLIEIPYIEDCIASRDGNLLVTFDESSIEHILLKDKKYSSYFEEMSLDFYGHKAIFGDDFALRYKLFGAINLWEGRAYLFKPRFPSEFQKMSKNNRWKMKSAK